jgi:two-component system, NarL family, invasion response regulator UvrY
VSSIYIVDDHTLFRGGLRAVLQATHDIVGESASPRQALVEIERLGPSILLLDLMLGSESGFELLAQLWSRQLPTRTIVLTMSAQPHHVAEALRMGASGYLLKGASVAELIAAIEAALCGLRQLSPEVADMAARGSAGAGASAIDTLSERERQVLMLVVRGESSACIATRLGLSPKTIDSYRSRLMAKLGVSGVAELVRYAVRTGLIDLDV